MGSSSAAPHPSGTRVRVRAVLRWLLALALLAGATQAQAAFGDCRVPQYLQRFDARLRAYDCVVAAQHRLVTPEGQRRLRIIHDRRATLDASTLAQADRGLRAGIAALGRIGRYALYDVSMLVVHDVPPPPDVMAVAMGVARGGAATPECQVTFYASGAPTDDIAPTIAHELFHCVQAATFSPGQNKTYAERSGGAWWIEGSAEWFASLALPDPSIYQDRAAAFADSIQRKPLYRHDYDSLVFFLWLAQRQGADRLMWFLAAMPQSPSDAGQRHGLRGALSEGEWMRFAIDLADGNIRRPHGPAFRSGLNVNTTWRWTHDRSDQLALKPYTVAAAVSRISCGAWTTEVAPTRMYVSRKPRRLGGEWGPLPGTIDTQGEELRYLHVATNVGDAQVNHRFGVRQTAGCSRCGDTTATDACLVGSWRQSAGGSLQWLRDNMPGGTRFRGEASVPVLTLQRDGLYRTSAVAGSVSMQPGASRTRAEADAQMQATGRWSAADGRFNLCVDLHALAGEMRLVAPDQTVRGPLPAMNPEAATMTYTCRGDTLHTEQAMPKPGGAGHYPPMRTMYTRVR